MTIKVISLSLIFFSVILIVWGIIVVHTLPGKVAKRLNHPQAKAIEITAYLGLLVFPLWMAALIWAYLRPVLKPIDLPEPVSILPADSQPEEVKKDEGKD